MREIKFRAWQKYHKKMVEVTSISFDDTGEINGVTTFVENQAPQRINYKDGLLGGFFLKDERGMVLELMQSTGLIDVNGVEIFEDDIVRYTWDMPSDVNASEKGKKIRISKVFWSEWRASWAVGKKSCNNDLFIYARNGNTVEIIGNIYENPELLETSE